MLGGRGIGGESPTSVENPKWDELDLNDGGVATHPTTEEEER